VRTQGESALSTNESDRFESLAPSPRRSVSAQYSRREFLTQAAIAPVVIAGFAPMMFAQYDGTKIKSPNGQIQFFLSGDPTRFAYLVTVNNQKAVDWSRLAITIDGSDITHLRTFGKVERYRTREKYATRGVHSTAVNDCNGARLSFQHTASGISYILEIRVFNNGLAFRFVIPGERRSRVPDEASTFSFIYNSIVWYHDFEGHYEGVHKKKRINDFDEGEWAAPPLTIKLSGNLGYAAITEAALMNYPGMGLRSDGKMGFTTVLGHELPVSHPFDLRYGKEEAKRLAKPAAINGTITTPWRVIMIGHDLNTLVNSDIISNLAPPPDEKIFSQGLKTDWIKPGRAVWRYLDGGENTFEGIKEFSRLAGQLGFEYNVVEGLWHRWTEEQMRELVEYSRQRDVGVWFWEHSKNLRTPEAREKFFNQLNRVGVVGIKIDFFDHEAKEIIDLYQALLRSSAEHRIMVEFHGANKPAGESRTWPNEMSREAIRGLEYRSMNLRSVHNATLPFTRFLAGHADYTPVHFGERRRETSWAHQIATAIVFTSPLMIYGAHPQHILDNPAAELIKTIPSVWDETIVLAQSAIGEMAAFARRKDDVWFVGILNALTGRELRVPLRFLSAGKYQATLVRDQMDDPAAVKIEDVSLGRSDVLTIRMRAGGGFVARFMHD
jgi:alpha-glucosidase